MTAIAAIINDLKSLSEAAMAAAHDGDWDAFERYEGVRRSLVAALSGIAADPVLRPQVVEALKNAQRLGLEIGMAVDRARAMQDGAASQSVRLGRAGRAYANARSA